MKNLEIGFPEVAASSERGGTLYNVHCQRCHGTAGEGVFNEDKSTYIYPPLWGPESYQPGSSMHRIIKMSRWLVANMPYDKATADKPVLTSAQALDIAAFINNDEIHQRPAVSEFQYPHPEQKAIDYDQGPFADTFSVTQHKYGPYPPIIRYLQSQKRKVNY